jgi:hypothetical protein
MVDRKDVLLAALALSYSRSLTPVQVQKAMFLISAEAKHAAPNRFYQFEKYNYGPFCADIYSDLAEFEAKNLLTVDQVQNRKVRVYRLTEDGAKVAAASQARLNPQLAAYLSSVVAWITSLSFPDLVREIYRKYPEYRENSVFSG